MNIETKVANLMDTLNYAVSREEISGVLRRALQEASRLPDGWVAAAVECEANNPWKAEVIDQLVVAHIYSASHETNPRKALKDAIAWNCAVALDPAVSVEAAKIVAAANSRAAATETLLRDADTALRDLGACAAPDCEEPNCLRIRQRIEQHLAGGW
jgi:hypothetical protein